MSRKVFVLCLEGLSGEHESALLDRLNGLRQLVPGRKQACLAHPGLSAIAPVWAELLTGRSWRETAATGYGIAKGSVNHVVPLQETDLPPLALLNERSKSVVINLPIVAPAADRRIWLADGSLPFGCVVSPPQLAEEQPFRSYKPRPFTAGVFGLGDVQTAVRQILVVERNRLECSRAIIGRDDWQLCIVRLTVFDQLFHLLGLDWLSDREYLLSDAIDQFITELNKWLESLSERLSSSTLFVMSTLGHAPCFARVNLDAVLQTGGFCSLRIEPTNELQKQRALANAIIHPKGGSTPAVTPSWRIDPERTLCASPSQGVIALNLKAKFGDGIVDKADAATLRQRVCSYLESWFNKHLNRRPAIVVPDLADRSNDLLIYSEGIEFHNSAIGPALDLTNKPALCHTDYGSVWLPEAEKDEITPCQLHEIIRTA